MTKREKLTRELNTKEYVLSKALLAELCDCQCHQPGLNILHFESCCEYGGIDTVKLSSEIDSLKKKLRK